MSDRKAQQPAPTAPARANPWAPDSFNRRVATACAIGVSILALALLLWYSVHVLLLVFAGVLIAILLSGLSDNVCDWTRLPRVPALALVTVVLVGGVALIIWLSAPRLVAEIGDLGDRLPQAIDEMRIKLEAHRTGRVVVQAVTKVRSLMPSPSGTVMGMVRRSVDLVVGVMVVFFTGLFLALNPGMYVRGVLHLFPPPRRVRAAEVLGAVGYTLKWWMIGQAVDMVVIGVATSVGLWLLGVPLALTLGFLAAAFNFIPNFGPLISLIPALLITLPNDPTQAFYVLVLYLVLQNIEGYLLMPLIQGKAASLPGAITIIAQVLMGLLAGGLGLALAAPLAAATLVAVKMAYVEDVLGDRLETPADQPAAEEVRDAKRAAAEVARAQKKKPPRSE